MLILRTENLSSESLFPIHANSILHYVSTIRDLNAALSLIYVVYSGLSIIENKAGMNQIVQDYKLHPWKRPKLNSSHIQSNM